MNRFKRFDESVTISKKRRFPLQSPFLVCMGGRGHIMLQVTKKIPFGNVPLDVCPNEKKSVWILANGISDHRLIKHNAS